MRKSCITLLLALVGGASVVTGATAAARRQPPSSNTPGGKASSPAPTSGTLGVAQLAAHVQGTDGSLYGGAGTTGSTRLLRGEYEVDFTRDVSQCFYSVSLADAYPLYAGVVPKDDNIKGVFVEIDNASGNLVDEDFYLSVFCSK